MRNYLTAFLRALFFAGCLLFSSSLLAGSLYLGPTLFLENTTSQLDNVREVHPRLSFGYWAVVDCFYLAGELFYDPFAWTISESNNTRSESARTTYNYGASFLPGLLLTEKIVAYLRGGYIATHFYGPDSTKSGGQFGAGLQSDLTANFSLRVEYLYTAYSGTSTLGSPSTDTYGIGFIYKLQ